MRARSPWRIWAAAVWTAAAIGVAAVGVAALGASAASAAEVTVEETSPEELEEASRPPGLRLDAGARRDLATLQQGWSEWLAAYEADDSDGEELALEGVLERLDLLGMSGIPELSVAASARAVESARLGDLRRAARALTAAERLDPGRPETAFARAAIQGRQGERWRGVISTFEGYTRLARQPLERRLWFHNAVLWSLTTALLGGCVFVVLLMAVRGPALFGSLLKPLRRWMPAPAAVAVVVALLLWPIAIPGGVLAIALNWALLLWTYSQRSEKVVLAALWILFGFTPLILDEQRRHVSVDLSPMTMAAEAARLGHLEGRLFTDLSRLHLLLPDNEAAGHLIADQYRRAGQCDQAMGLYEGVLEADPDNARAWVDLGACRFLRGEYDRAIEIFRRGTSLDAEVAQGHFNLSLAYSELYDFAESERSLTRAQALDSSAVARWLEESPRRGVAEVAAGVDRAAEVRRHLRRSWLLEDEQMAWSSPLEDYRSIPIAAAGLLLSFVLSRFLPRSRLESQAPPLIDWGGRRGEFYRVMLPGIAELEAGESVRAVLSVTILIGLLLLPWVAAYGYRIPWGLEPDFRLGWLGAAVGLTLYFVLRWRRELAY